MREESRELLVVRSQERRAQKRRISRLILAHWSKCTGRIRADGFV